MFESAFSAMSGESQLSDLDILDKVVLQLCNGLNPDKLVFQGGYVLNKIITDDTPRGTIDVDVSIDDVKYYSEVLKVLKDIGENLKSDGIILKYELILDASVEHSGGIKLYRDGNNPALGVDVGIREFSSGIVPFRFSGISTNRFSVYRMLSDKMRALYTDVCVRRAKDLYDVYIITNCFDIDSSKLLSQISDDGGIDFNKSPLRIEVLDKFKYAYSKMKIRSTVAGLYRANTVSFDDAIQRLILFTENLHADAKWDCSLKQFVRSGRNG